MLCCWQKMLFASWTIWLASIVTPVCITAPSTWPNKLVSHMIFGQLYGPKHYIGMRGSNHRHPCCVTTANGHALLKGHIGAHSSIILLYAPHSLYKNIMPQLIPCQGSDTPCTLLSITAHAPSNNTCTHEEDTVQSSGHGNLRPTLQQALQGFQQPGFAPPISFQSHECNTT